MPRRTGIDTVFDNRDAPSVAEMMDLQAQIDAEAEADWMGQFGEGPLDDEDENQFEEGVPGEYGNTGEDPGMSDDDYEAAISSAIEAAEQYIDSELSPDRELAARYYRGEEFGNEDEDRSRVVMTEVRDTVLSVLPAMLRIFCGTADAVEFVNNEGTPETQAKTQTAYINHIINVDNDGFTIMHSAFKDAFIRKTGIFTWWYEEKETATEEILTGLNEEAFALLQMEKSESSSEDENIRYDIEIMAERPDTANASSEPDLIGADQYPDPMADDPMADPMQPRPPEPVNMIRDVRVKRIFIKKRHRVAAVPPEEFIVTPTTSSDLDEFQLVGRRSLKTIGEVVALGHSEGEVRAAIGAEGTPGRGGNGTHSAFKYNSEATDRNPNQAERLFDTGFENVDPSSEYIKYCVVYPLIDKDGDGIPERRKVVTVGDNNVVIYDAMIDEMVPFALICPDPEPHSPFGYSLADQTMDLQEITSEMVRGILDSLAESIVGRTAILEGQVNIDDAMSNARNQLIRVKTIGAVAPLSRPFDGMNAMPVLEYFQQIKARRTGVTMTPAGLKADTLQSTSTDAVNAVVDAAQERTEMIARIFAETGIKRLFRGLLQNVVRHQDGKRVIRIRGKATLVDPRSFVADLDLDVNVGLGRGTGEKRLNALSTVFAQAKEIYTTYGPNNPIVGLDHISNIVEDMVRENGFNDVSRYMNVISKEEAAKIKADAAAAPPEKSDTDKLVEAQMAKVQADAQAKGEAEMTKRMIAKMADDRSRDESDQDFYIRAAEVMGKFGIAVNEAEVRQAMEADRNADNLADRAQQGAQAQIAPPQGGQPSGPTR